jgi:hypothetical protein
MIPVMNDRPPSTRIIDYKGSARSLREACQMMGCYDEGRRCPDCPLKELCESEARWLVQREALPLRYD